MENSLLHAMTLDILIKMFRSKSSKAPLAIALLVLAGVAAGCGGSSDESQTTALTKAEFVKQANAICYETKERSAAAYKQYAQTNAVPSSGPGLTAKAADLVENVFIPIYDEQIEKISALGTPIGDEKEVDAILTAMQAGVEGAKREPLPFIRESAALNRASQLAVAYGLPECSNGSV